MTLHDVHLSAEPIAPPAPLSGPWQTLLRAEFDALAAKNVCAPLFGSAETSVVLKGVTRAFATTSAGEGRARNCTNALLLAFLPRTSQPLAGVRLLAAVVQGDARDEASAVAGQTIFSELESRFRDRTHWDVQRGGLAHALTRAVVSAHRRVLAISADTSGFDPHWTFARGTHAPATFRGMTASVTVAALTGNVATIAHVGKSAALLLRNDDVERITPDHALSALPAFAAAVPLPEDRARFGPLARQLVGRERDLDVSCVSRHLRPDDTLVLASASAAQAFLDDAHATTAAAEERDLALACQRMTFLVDDAESDIAVVALRPDRQSPA